MLNINTYHLNGVNHPIKIFSQLKRLNWSIVLLQETHLDDREEQKLKREWMGQIFGALYENRKKRGVAILCQKSIGLIPVKITCG